ncbi:putative disease resistance RPP13-like protein 3 [Brachypodium distachyon]|uniref:NB-ARC domain-containing protein n=1 Tax=Brachypodium distachyon TaxID=15368 RepID=I1IV28_BRADI|nr:putative disease resistance RPP13-like protein 3 [Brachypodium distachyon]XP_014758424.1 putative disease resistance RPP13-like protein 3 [Brachypodium distachyon]PNT65564.1 hypothetical protein BRADI_4g44556v3 [Brachypodium distachyon]PNT65566.1 hypothetical protein BRADI_4g44556v3 [Brachypodium distachyon]PNT65568.1 hypothetical protein BRADI_4g44556v3 [Brachypodium distachyon]|eukprot:XP_014758423.1 putative disease resistance RPP13-like protein 3 [Brachypodium distachyon]
MKLVTGAMSSLLPKLAELLQDEYNLQTGVKKDVESLSRELESIEVALAKVAEVPLDQLDKQVRLCSRNVKQLSYEMEDIVDGFMVRVEGSEPDADLKRSKRFRKKIANFFKKGKTRHQIADKIQDIKVRVREVADLRDRYKIDDVRANLSATNTVDHVHANLSATNTVDPRITALFKDQKELIGIEEPRNELIKRLMMEGDDDGLLSSRMQLKILSIFGFGGLGKTTLAKTVYDKLQGEFVCRAFISVGQNPSVKKVLMDILCKLDENSYLNATMLDEEQLIGKLCGLLENKRFPQAYSSVKLCEKLEGDDDGGVLNSKMQLKILSIFGFGGLGKTTLAKAVYDLLQSNFVCKAFVSVGQNPNLKKVFMDILLQLDEKSSLNASMLNEEQLIRKLRGFLENKRYLIVIDDIWDKIPWNIMKCALIDSNCGSRIITTTPIFEVAEEADDV